MQHEVLELRGRLRAVNLEHRRLLRESTSEGWFARMGMLRSERRALMAQIADALCPIQVRTAGGYAPREAAKQGAPGH